MVETIRLYRGDHVKIRKFEAYKTSVHSLVGQGFYLTDNEKVAQSYRLKGSGIGSTENVLLNQEVENMNVAREMALAGYIRFQLCRDRHYKIANDPKKVEALKPAYRSDFERLLEDGTISIKWFQGTAGERTRRFQAIYLPDDIGYITSFDFPRKHLESNVLNLETRTPDPGLLDVAWERGCVRKSVRMTRTRTKENFDQPLETKEQLHALVSSNGVFPAMFNCNKLKDIVQREYGIIGFEYKGGIRIGGLGTHRAFNLFDERFVNEHRTERYR
jgi:hypothetical protein